MKHYQILIIGNSAAGLAALRKIRELDRQVSVALVDREDCPAYSRVLTPYYIGGKAPKEKIYIVDRAFYQQMGVETYFGAAVSELNVADNRVILTDGTRLAFSQCLIAVGAEATQVAVTSDKVSPLRHMADAEKIIALNRSARSITGIGAGLVSIPLLSHAAPELEKNLIIGSGRVFSRVVNPEAAGILEKIFIDKGVVIYKNDDIADYQDGERLQLTLRSGAQLTTDALFVGKGVVPNTTLASNAGLQVKDGVIIDRYSRTSAPHIYAAGDCAEGIDFVSGELTIQGNWMTAVEQGEVAACAMLGQPVAYAGSLKNNITEIFGVDVAVVGYYWDDAPATDCFYNAASGCYRKIFLDKERRVIGAVLIGESNCSGIFTNLVKTRARYPGSSWLRKTVSYADMVRFLR